MLVGGQLGKDRNGGWPVTQRRQGQAFIVEFRLRGTALPLVARYEV
jgi:hypothetical protein